MPEDAPPPSKRRRGSETSAPESATLSPSRGGRPRPPRWTRVEAGGDPPGPRWGAASCQLPPDEPGGPTRLAVLGGERTTGPGAAPVPVADLYVLSGQPPRWSASPSVDTGGRAWSTLVAAETSAGRQLVAFGGERGGTVTAEFGALDSDLELWRAAGAGAGSRTSPQPSRRRKFSPLPMPSSAPCQKVLSRGRGCAVGGRRTRWPRPWPRPLWPRRPRPVRPHIDSSR